MATTEKNIRISTHYAGQNGTMYSIEEVCDLIRHDEYTKRYCKALRGDDIDDGLKVTYKEQLRKCEFASVCNGGREIANIDTLTGYLVVDIDKSGIDYSDLRSKVIADAELNPMLVFTSPSGKLKIVLKLNQLEYAQLSGQAASDLYGEYHRQVAIYMVDRYGIVPDLDCGDGVRLCYLSHDDNVYYNKDGVCAINFYPLGDERVEERYAVIFADEKGGNTPMRSIADGDFNEDMYAEKVHRLVADLVVDADGNYVWDKDRRVTIGSRSGGTADVNVGGYSGYSLKFRLNVAAVWLFNGDVAKAQEFIGNSFTDSGDLVHKWTKCGKCHLKYLPNWDVLLWIVNTFSFKTLHKVPVTELSYMSDFVARTKGEDITVAGQWRELMREYGLPKMLDSLMNCIDGNNSHKDLVLYSFLTVMSGFAKRQTVKYNGKGRGLNLLLNVLGTAASGKSGMMSGVEHLLPSLNFAANQYNIGAKEYYAMELDEYKRAKKDKDAQVDVYPPKKPPYIANFFPNSTIQGFCQILNDNNGKFVMVNEEFSNLTKSEKGQYGGLLSFFKNIFDNAQIGIVTRNGLMESMVNVVGNPNCAVMLSGTFGQFNELYTSIEDGLLSRFIYYTLPTVKIEEYEYPRQERKAVERTMLDVEMEFLQWHFWCALNPDNNRRWKMKDSDWLKFKAVMENFVIEYCKVYCVGDEVSQAIQSYMFRFGDNVARVAALLSSLAMFERNFYNPNCGCDNEEFAQNPKIYVNDRLNNRMEVLGEFTFDQYVSVQNGYAYSGDPNECVRFNTPNEYSFISYEYMVAALKLLLPSIIHGIRALESYRKSSRVVKNVHPRESDPIYMAYDKCNNEFTFSEYRNVLSILRGDSKTFNPTVTRALDRLIKEGILKRDGDKYVKLNAQ